MASRISLTDRVHAQLREEIITGAVASGSMHSIYEIAERLQVSRTPVRDAVLRLADAGMVTIERNRGVRIRGVSVQDVREVFEARLLLEVPSAAHAAIYGDDTLLKNLEEKMISLGAAVDAGDEKEFIHRDRELHTAIILATGNSRLAGLVDSLRDITQSHGVSTIDNSRSIREVQVEHQPIVDAILRRDAEAAASLMQQHLTITGQMLMRQVAQATGEELPDDWPPFQISN